MRANRRADRYFDFFKSQCRVLILARGNGGYARYLNFGKVANNDDRSRGLPMLSTAPSCNEIIQCSKPRIKRTIHNFASDNTCTCVNVAYSSSGFPPQYLGLCPLCCALSLQAHRYQIVLRFFSTGEAACPSSASRTGSTSEKRGCSDVSLVSQATILKIISVSARLRDSPRPGSEDAEYRILAASFYIAAPESRYAARYVKACCTLVTGHC